MVLVLVWFAYPRQYYYRDRSHHHCSRYSTSIGFGHQLGPSQYIVAMPFGIAKWLHSSTIFKVLKIFFKILEWSFKVSKRSFKASKRSSKASKRSPIYI